MDTQLPEDIRLLQRTVRGFVDDVLAPCAKEIEEKDEISRTLITKMGEAGLFGIGHDEALGGQGFGKLGYCVAVEQLARVNASLWNVVGGSAGLCGTAISVGGPDEVRRRYLPDLFSARKVGAYALSEPGAGSDAGSLKTAARRDEDAYVIDGAKTFITNAPIADVFVIFANAAPASGSKGITAFVVERGAKGLEIGPNQAIQWMVADAATEIHAARLMVYDAASRADRGERITDRAAMAKLFATELLGRVADAAVQIHGGMGYMRELWIERAYRDARITRIYEGTSEIQRLVIAQGLLADA